MKIVSILSKGYPFPARGSPVFPGGAQITNLSFLRKLTAVYGHQCVLLTVFPNRRTARCGGVSIVGCRDTDELRRTVEAFRPDVVLTALGLSFHSVRIASHLGIPSLVYHHAYECCPPTREERFSWGVSAEHDHLGREEAEFVSRHAERLVACSSFLRDHVRRTGGSCQRVIYPEFDPERVVIPARRPSPQGFITGVCGYAYKGAEVFLELARSFPEERFQVCGNLDPAFRRRFEAQANITIVSTVTTKEMLRNSKIVIVPSQWPEPFGRTAVEAMGNGIPVLVSAAGGLPEAAAGPAHQVRDFRNVVEWRVRLEELLESETSRERNGELGRRLSKRFLEGRSTAALEEELRQLVGRRTPRPRPQKVVALCGEREEKTAYALVNAHWERASRKQDRMKFVHLTRPSDLCPQPVDVFVHHDYQQDFKTVSVPDEGKFVAVRTWDFGGFPPAWVEKINAECDQLWVHSGWVRESAIRSGIDPRRVRVVPLGIDERVFRPRGSAYALPTRKTFRFLFVGRTVIRKGIDILLKAYSSAFGPRDDVCLVIKDNPRDVFYTGIDFRKQILDMASDPKAPEIVYVDEFLPAGELAALYRSCHASVFPYRAEGFCMPILEAMACGLPCVVPDFGACRDYCTRENSFLVPAKRISLPVARDFAINTLGFREEIREVDFCEVPVEALAGRMRDAVESGPDLLRRKSRAASSTAHGRFRWQDSVDRMTAFLMELEKRRTPVRLARTRRLHREHPRAFQVARELFLGMEQANEE